MSRFTSASSTTASIIRSAATSSSAGSMRASTSAGSAPPFSASFVRLFVDRRERRARPRRARRRTARRAAPTLRRPARCRRPSGRRRRRERARTPSRSEAIVARMPYVDVNGARLWVEEEGDGPAVLFLHGGLGDLRLFEPQARALAGRFRCIRFDLRLWGRSETPGRRVLVDRRRDRRARRARCRARGARRPLVRRRARDRRRARASGAVVGARARRRRHQRRCRSTRTRRSRTPRSRRPRRPATSTPRCRSTSTCGRRSASTTRCASSGTRRRTRSAFPTARAAPRARTRTSGSRRSRRRRSSSCATHDPPELKEAGATVARQVPGAHLVEVDSDHYLTLRAARAGRRAAARLPDAARSEPSGRRSSRSERRWDERPALLVARRGSRPSSFSARRMFHGSFWSPRHGTPMQCATPRTVSSACTNG